MVRPIESQRGPELPRGPEGAKASTKLKDLSSRVVDFANKFTMPKSSSAKLEASTKPTNEATVKKIETFVQHKE